VRRTQEPKDVVGYAEYEQNSQNENEVATERELFLAEVRVNCWTVVGEGFVGSWIKMCQSVL